jgi:branched-subunit amino acid aminotransferase/4-amino-4-deoxychorismate lyase
MMGWREVAIDGETHLKRLMDMCNELDFEIRTEEVNRQDVEECTQCLQERGEKIYRVYARHKKEVQE